MNTPRVVLLADEYRIREQYPHSNAAATPRFLSHAVKFLAPASYCVAVVEEYDQTGIGAYEAADFKVHTMNGNRNQAIKKVVNGLQTYITDNRPEYLVAVTNDPVFEPLFQTAQNLNTEIRLFVPGERLPETFFGSGYDARLLREILPPAQPPQGATFVDFENILIGLRQNGLQATPKQLIETIQTKADTLCHTHQSIQVYADWDTLAQGDSANLQREVALISGVETRYLPGERGKNSADMKIADDIRDSLEVMPGQPGFSDTIFLCTGDRDFRPVVDTAKQKGKRVIVFATKGSLSKELIKAVDTVYFLDDLLLDNKPNRLKPNDPLAKVLTPFLVTLKRNRWNFIYVDRFAGVLGKSARSQINVAIQAGVILQRGNKLYPNWDHPLTPKVKFILDHIPTIITQALHWKKLQYVDTNYIYRQLTQNDKFCLPGITPTRQETEQWLHLMARAGMVSREHRTHFKNPRHQVIAWNIL